MAQIIQLRRDTAANWTANDPVLAQGEMGVERDTLKFKIGDGVNAWHDLAYGVTGIGDVVGPASVTTDRPALFDGTTGKLLKQAGAALGTAAAKNIPATGDASATEVVYGSDTRLTDARTPAAHTQAVTAGGTGLTTVADGSILAANAANTLSAVTWHSSGDKVLTNKSGTISWEDAAAGTGDVATDAIWAAAGDLAVGTGSDTAGTLSKGSAGQVLAVKGDGSTLEWATVAGTGDVTAAANIGDTKLVVGSGGAKGVAASALTADFVKCASGVPSAVAIDGTSAEVVLGRSTASSGAPELLATTGTRGTAVVLATSPTLVTPILGTPQSGTLTNCTFPTLNQNTSGSAASCTGNSATVTVADESSDTTCFPLFATAATGSLEPKTVSSLTFNSNTGALAATLFAANTITANTAFVPDANDGAALGTTSLQFSDLFLATGAVVNFANGDYTITHASGLLTFSGGVTQPYQNLGYQTIATAGGTTTLTVASPHYTVFTGTESQTVSLPDARTLVTGRKICIDNDSTAAVTVKTTAISPGTASTVWTIAAGCDLYLTCTGIGTADGTWEKDYNAAKCATGTSLTVTASGTIATGSAAFVAASTLVANATYNAHTILAATTDDTPAALTVGEQTLVGRITSGNIAALSTSTVRTLLNVADGSQVNVLEGVTGTAPIVAGAIGAKSQAISITASSTSSAGSAPQATAPGSGLLSVLAIANGETARTDKAIFDTTNPADIGTAGPGTQLLAARRDHVHAIPANGVTLAMLATQAANTVLANATTGAAVPTAVTVAEQTLVGRLTGGNVDDIAIGIADNAILQVDDASAADNDYAKFTANGLEGVPYATVLSDIGALPLAGGTLTGAVTLDDVAGAITLVEGSSIELDAAGSADEKWCGITIPGTAGATVAVGDLCYMNKASDYRWELADADADASAGSVILGLCVLAGNDGDATRMLTYGTMRSAAFPASIAIGAPVYVSVDAGDITATAPSGTTDIVRVVGHAITAEPNTILFNPSTTWIELA